MELRHLAHHAAARIPEGELWLGRREPMQVLLLVVFHDRDRGWVDKYY